MSSNKTISYFVEFSQCVQFRTYRCSNEINSKEKLVYTSVYKQFIMYNSSIKI